MKRIAVGFALAVMAASGRMVIGQHQGNPFVDHSDTGETIHVLPPPAAIHSPRATQPPLMQRHTVVPPCTPRATGRVN